MIVRGMKLPLIIGCTIIVLALIIFPLIVSYKAERKSGIDSDKFTSITLILKTWTKVKQKKLNEESILVPNTYVVHKFHGIGLYEGTEVKKIKDVDKDYLSIKFGGTDRLYVPSDQINELEVYVGGENPKLSRLGGGDECSCNRR